MNEHGAWCGRLPQIPLAKCCYQVSAATCAPKHFVLHAEEENLPDFGTERWSVAVSQPSAVATAKWNYLQLQTGRSRHPWINLRRLFPPSWRLGGREARNTYSYLGTQHMQRKPRACARAPPLQRFWPPSQGSFRQGTHVFVSRHDVAPGHARRTPSITSDLAIVHRLPAAKRGGSSGRAPSRFLVAGQLDSCTTPASSHGAAKEEIGTVRTTM